MHKSFVLPETEKVITVYLWSIHKVIQRESYLHCTNTTITNTSTSSSTDEVEIRSKGIVVYTG